ncbi:rhomboid family intramembrane serine protease GlpG [Ferrimonas sediminicola]|uniref:Rhomboid family intramembrane serine protease GlpG n=1 Tax=Ferrimonas sediminicola TaxID=2569538 RepID=A0A4U1BBQ3_9GAMM|nr:rhomboid family intramembrane serine protease GlpG [Ferrimonas sediminicola]TKB47600.1 rhomboid family intramembrane serine protease GlpG [Ferrimonas sediminicola]
MIALGVLDNARAAQAFVDYLAGLGVKARLSRHDHGVEIWVAETDQPRAQSEFERFLADPHHPRYHEASWNNGSTSNSLSYGKPMSQMMTTVLNRAGPLTLVVMAACIAVFIPWAMKIQQPLFYALHFFESWEAFSLDQGWRLFSPVLLHFDPMHIAFNLLWWWYLGGQVEKRLGSGKLLVLLLAGAAVPNLVQFAMVGPAFGGLSGVVYALVGYCWLMGRMAPQRGIVLPDAYMSFLMIWLVLGFAGFMNMANWAHLGGLLVGLAQAVVDGGRHRR